MARETWVQSQVESYQRLKKWYLMPPCLTLSIIRYGSRVKWSNPGKGVAPSPTPWFSKLSKREPSGHLRLWSPTLLTFYIYNGNSSYNNNNNNNHIALVARISLTLSRHSSLSFIALGRSSGQHPVSSHSCIIIIIIIIIRIPVTI